MQKKPFLIILFCTLGLLLALSSCNKKAKSAMAKQKLARTLYLKQQLSIGSGGGFTGEVVTFNIMPQGNITKISSRKNTDTLRLQTMSEEDQKKLQETFDQLDFKNVQLNCSSNRYYFIAAQFADSTAHHIQWGDPKQPVDEKISMFYKNTMDLIHKYNQ